MRLIDADVFKHHLKNCICELKNTNQVTDDYETVLKALNNQPTIDPKRGKWKGYWKSQFMGCDDFGNPIYRDGKIYYCSKCNRRTIIKENFCPNCGADMRGEK